MEEVVPCQNEHEKIINKFHDDNSVITKAVEQLRMDCQCLDIGQQQLISFPENLYTYCANLKFLYLEGNLLESLPASLFPSLPQLRWLDARSNLLKELPGSVAHHRSLEVLLLQGNQLRELPLELGLVPRLRGLQLAGNPLRAPPADVVGSGVQAVLSYLRQQWAIAARSPPAVQPVEKLIYKGARKDRVCSGGGGPKSRWSATARGRRPARIPRPKAKSADLPAIAVRGYRYSKELVAPGTTPALTHDRESPDFKTDENIQHLNKFRSVEEKIFHLWPSASTDRTSRNSPSRHCSSGKMECKAQEAYLKDVCVHKLKEMLARQASVLQRTSDAAVLKSWRKDITYSNVTRSKKSVVPPYGTDPSYACALSQAEARDPAGRQGRNMASSANVCRSLDEEMGHLLLKLQEQPSTANVSPRVQQRALRAEMHKLTELQRRLQALKLRNDCAGTPGVAAREQPHPVAPPRARVTG